MILKPWTTNETQTHITLQKQVVVKPLGVSMATTAACICGVSLLTTRAGNATSSSKNYNAQTLGQPAPVCKDALSGLDPANIAALSLTRARPMINAIGRKNDSV